MSSNQTIPLGGQVSYYFNLDDSRFSVQFTNQFSFSQQSKQQKKQPFKNNSDKKDQSSDMSYLNFKHMIDQDPNTSKPLKPKVYVSLLPDALNKKIKSRKSQITIYFFNSDKKISFQREQINKAFDNKTNKTTIKQFISYAVKSYCRLFLNFQPHQICQGFFQLKLANFDNHDDGTTDPFDHAQSINFLFDAANLVLTRKPRPIQRVDDWRKIILAEKPDQQIVQILMPARRQLVEHVQKSKSINYLKQKILSYNNQLGKIVLVTYNSFKICEGKKKIADMDEKVFEVYRQKIQDYLDKPIVKNLSTNQNNSYNNVNYYEQLWKSPFKKQNQLSETQSQIYVNQSTISGKLTLSIFKTSIIQKFTGGIIQYLHYIIPSSSISANPNEYMREYSIHTLVGINNQVSPSNLLKLKFIYKDRQEIKQYKFQYNENKLMFLKNLLKIGRLYNKIWKKI